MTSYVYILSVAFNWICFEFQVDYDMILYYEGLLNNRLIKYMLHTYNHNGKLEYENF